MKLPGQNTPLGQQNLPWVHQSSAAESQVPAQLGMWDGGTMLPITTLLLTGFGAPGKPLFCQNRAAGAPKNPSLGCCGPPSCGKSAPRSRQQPMLASVWLGHSKAYCTEGFYQSRWPSTGHRIRVIWSQWEHHPLDATISQIFFLEHPKKSGTGDGYTHGLSQEAFYHGACCLWVWDTGPTLCNFT